MIDFTFLSFLRFVGGPVGHVERSGQRPLFNGRRLQQPFECRRRLQITDAKLPAALQHKQVTISSNIANLSSTGGPRYSLFC